VLGQAAYAEDFEGDSRWRLTPGTAEHARRALLSLPGAEIAADDEDEVEAALREVDELWPV
jgi:hypothetical protein